MIELHLTKLILVTLIFMVLMTIYLKLCKKISDKKQKNILHIIFSIASGFIGIVYINYGFFEYNDRLFNAIFVVSFICGILLDKKCNIIVSFIIILGLYFAPDVFDSKEIIIPDMLGTIFSSVLGYVSGHIIHKKNWPHTLTSIIYGVMFTTAYMVFVLFFYEPPENTNVAAFFEETYIEKNILFTVVTFIMLLYLNIFFKKEKDEKEQNDILHKFLKKFRIIIVILYVVMLIFTYAFCFAYSLHDTTEMVSINYNIAKTASNKHVKKDGLDYYKKNNFIQINYNNWLLSAKGAVFVYDENRNRLNEFDDGLLKKINIKDLTDDEFDDVLKYPKDEVVYYEKNGQKLLIEYGQMGMGYLLMVVPITTVRHDAICYTLVCSYVIVIILMVIFWLIFNIFNKSIVYRMHITNEKLSKIASGDYDVHFEDDSFTEMQELSDHINMTVDFLKNNIKEIEQRNEEEMRLAKTIQESQLRNDNIEHIAYDINAINIPAEDVGGDFYDYFYIDYRRVMFLIADVSGKGIPGAMFMIKAKNAFISYAKQKYTLSDIVSEVNNLLTQNNDALMFVTCFIGILDLKTGLLKYINAGHNNPIIGRKMGDKIEYKYIESKSQRLFGVESDVKYEVENMTLNEGDRLILYTDGVTEARNKNKEFFGEDRFLQVLKNIDDNNPMNINKKIIDAVYDFSKGVKQFDDITLLSLIYTGTKNEIIINANEENFNVGKEYLNKFIKLYEMDANTERNLKIVYDEIYSNIKKYAYHDKGGDFIFKVNLIERDIIEMVFMDKGEEFDPITCKSKKFEVKAEDKVDGGMGIMFCKNIMDDMKYERKDGYNILKMYKKF